MSISDPIANLLSTIQNAISARKHTTFVAYSKYNQSILSALKTEKIIDSFCDAQINDHKKLKVKINRQFKNFKRISKPGRRLYGKARQMPIKRESIIIVSTSQGLMNSKQAKSKHLGGELIMEVS